MGTGWIHAISHDALRRKRSAVFRHDGKQIALFDTAAGVYARNNRCPHEGNPLREGTLDGSCILACGGTTGSSTSAPATISTAAIALGEDTLGGARGDRERPSG